MPSPSSVIAQTNSPTHLIGPATTVAQFMRALGGVIGIAVFSTIFANVSGNSAGVLIGDVAKIYGLTESQLQVNEFLSFGGRVFCFEAVIATSGSLTVSWFGAISW